MHQVASILAVTGLSKAIMLVYALSFSPILSPMAWLKVQNTVHIQSYKLSIYGSTETRGWFNTGPCCKALSQPSMCLVPQSMCTVHITRCIKCKFAQFLNCIFTKKMWVNSRFILTDGDSETSSHQVRGEFTSKNCEFISVSKLLFLPQFSMAVACCYNGWILNTSSLCNAWWTDLHASSAMKPIRPGYSASIIVRLRIAIYKDTVP